MGKTPIWFQKDEDYPTKKLFKAIESCVSEEQTLTLIGDKIDGGSENEILDWCTSRNDAKRRLFEEHLRSKHGMSEERIAEKMHMCRDLRAVSCGECGYRVGKRYEVAVDSKKVVGCEDDVIVNFANYDNEAVTRARQVLIIVTTKGYGKDYDWQYIFQKSRDPIHEGKKLLILKLL